MSLRNEIDAYRRCAALRLGHDQKDRRTVIENLRARLVQVEKETKIAKGPLARAQKPLPAADICPRCWIERGLQIPMQRPENGEAVDIGGQRLYRCTAPTCRLEVRAAD